MRTYINLLKLSFSVLSVSLPLCALCAPVEVNVGQNKTPVESDKPKTIMGLPDVGGLTRNRIGDFSPALLEAAHKCNEAIARGDVLARSGAYDAAIVAFQEAISHTPDGGFAYQRLAEVETADGRLEDAAATYRTLLYKWPGKSWSNSQNGDPALHMRFALVLLRLHQRAEALTVYQRGYQLLQLEEAPTATTPARGPLPPMIDSADWTAAQMEAAADTVIGIHKYDWISQDLARADFQHALSLQPRLAVPYFYLGQIDKFKAGRSTYALAAFDQAERLGGPEMKPFIDKAQKEGLYEFTAAARKAKPATP